MDISFAESLVFALVCAVTEFLPVSSSAHEQILLRLFGLNRMNPLLQLFIHLGVLAALFFSCKNYLHHMSREANLRKIPKRRRKRQPNLQTVMDLSFLKTACVPLIIGFVLYNWVGKWQNLLPVSAAFLMLNGFVLHIPVYFTSGNRDSRSMTRLDALAFGALSGFGIVPGLSRIGIAASYGSLRAADHGQVYKWCLLLSIPAVAVSTVIDIIVLVTDGLASVDFIFVIQCFLSTAIAWIGATISIHFMKSFTAKSGMSGFSYYCFGAALFAFILYLYT